MQYKYNLLKTSLPYNRQLMLTTNHQQLITVQNFQIEPTEK